MSFNKGSILILIGLLSIPSLHSVTTELHRSSYTEILPNVLKLIDKPLNVLTFFCGNYEKELKLIRSLSSSENAFTSTRLHASKGSVTCNSPLIHLSIIVDLAQCSNQEIVNLFTDNPSSVTFSHWFIINTANPSGAVDIPKIKETFASVPLNHATHLYFWTESSNDTLHLKMAYKLYLNGHFSPLTIEDNGHFSNASAFTSELSHNVTSMRRKNLQGAEFPMGAVVTDPETPNHFFDFVDLQVDPVTKSGIRVSVIILQFLNADPKLVLSDSWGSLNATSGKWTGMFGDLISGAAELGGTPSFIRPERAAVADYLAVSLESYVSIVFRAPKLSYTTNIYVLPFQRGVWAASMILFSAMIILLLGAAFREWKTATTTEEQDRRRPKFVDVVFMVFSAICNQESSFSLQSVSGRIVFISCLVLVVCLFVSYCAFIVVLLQAQSNNIKTAYDLLHSRMEVGAQDTIYNRYWLKVNWNRDTNFNHIFNIFILQSDSMIPWRGQCLNDA